MRWAVKRWIGGLGAGLLGGAALAVLHGAQAEDDRRAGAEHQDSVAPADRAADVEPASPWAGPAACERVLAEGGRASGRAAGAARGPRIGTWNLHWFPDGRSGSRTGPEDGTDVAWMACVIAWLDVDVLAVQEVKQTLGGRRALLALLEGLESRTGTRWEAKLDECPDDGRQHVGFVWRVDRVNLGDVRMVGALNPTGSACAHRLRPGLAARAELARGPDLVLMAVHFDSGTGGRDYRNRRASVEQLGRALRRLTSEAGDADVVVAGDFNTMGCKRCAPPVEPDGELARMRATLGEVGLRRLQADHPCTQYYRGRGTELDHIVTSRALRGLPPEPRVEVHGPCAELACAARRGPLARSALARLSDHCPLVLELATRERER